MLYLAEIQKQRGGLLGGGGKSELKLLASQRSDQNWSSVPDETIVADEASKFNDGALVLVDLSPNRQVQRIQEAGRPLVNILQNLSRQVERFKLKEEEIDQWKQSLNLQVQELNRREMEMESLWEQVQKLENDSKNVERQQQSINTSRTETERLQAELERNRQELEGAWEHLRVEQRSLQETMSKVQKSQFVDEELKSVLDSLINRLSAPILSIDEVRKYLNYAFEFSDQQQNNLNIHWQKLEVQRHSANQQQKEGEELVQILFSNKQQLQQAQDYLAQQLTQMQLKTAVVNSKRELATILKWHLGSEEELSQKLRILVVNTDVKVSKPEVDVTALEQMPMKELERMIQDCQDKLERDSGFVQEQEQELKYKQELIEEIQQKIVHSSEEEKVNLESELADEQDLYQMLNKSLVGQRCNLIGQQKTLQQNQVVLWQRQGILLDTKGEPSDFESIISELETQKQQKSAEIEGLEIYIAQMLTAMETDQELINHETQEVEEKRRKVNSLEEQFLNLRMASAEYMGRISLYQEALQPIQDALDRLREQLDMIAGSLTQLQEFDDSRMQVVAELRQVIGSFMNLSEVN
ncbi:MAG: pilus motility taxis protein HmpF [Anabaena sp. CoA2_C59]|nr:pilus motility taxis protein HmpF [Anabaena sp. CoA2_C59]MDJ0506660.1 pilus motility taxis protein HmpF [Nostocales cyanobacterium LE14-WE12]